MPDFESLENAFTYIYDNAVWGNGSGASSPDLTSPYMEFLSAFIRQNNVTSVVDVGCGDWQFSREMDWSGIDYTGIDVVTSVIDENNSKFSSENVRFKVYNEIFDVGKGDLVICKDVLQHLPSSDVIEYLDYFTKNFKFALVTNDILPADNFNGHIEAGGWRALRLDQEPFNRDLAVLLRWEVAAGDQRWVKDTVLLGRGGTSSAGLEVPRLAGFGNESSAYDVRDAAGLRRIAEEQAADLVRLRRELNAARSTAAERLRLIRGETDRPAQEDLVKVQNDISEVVERSRWWLLGRRLGFGRGSQWENDNWRTGRAPTGPGSHVRAHGPNQTELARLTALREALTKSRWRRVGQRLGLAKVMPWEKPQASPIGQSQTAISRRAASPPPPGEGHIIDDPCGRFVNECRAWSVDVVVGIGPRQATLAIDLRRAGYAGQLISFEAKADERAALLERAAQDPLWDVCSLGPNPLTELSEFTRRTFADPTTVWALAIDISDSQAPDLPSLLGGLRQVDVVLCRTESSWKQGVGAQTMSTLAFIGGNGFTCVSTTSQSVADGGEACMFYFLMVRTGTVRAVQG